MHRLASLILLFALPGCEAPQPRLVAFTAAWCQPCQRDKPMLATLGNVTVVDIDAHPELARSYSITTLPTYILFDADGIEIKRTNDLQVILKLL